MIKIQGPVASIDRALLKVRPTVRRHVREELATALEDVARKNPAADLKFALGELARDLRAPRRGSAR